MGNAFVTGVIAAAPAVFIYVVLMRRIEELKEFSYHTRKQLDDNLDYIFEELSDVRQLGKVETKTLSTSAPAVMVSAPAKKKRVRKTK